MRHICYGFIALATLMLASCSNTPKITLKATYRGIFFYYALEEIPEDELIVREKWGKLCIDRNHAWLYCCSEKDITPVLEIAGDTLFVTDSITCINEEEGAEYMLQYKIHHLPYGKYVLIYSSQDEDFPATEINYQPDMQPLVIPDQRGAYLNEEPMTIDTSMIFVVVESMPEFPDGANAMVSYIDSHKMAVDTLTSRKRPILQFVVERDGSLSNIEVIRSCGNEGLDRDAVSVVANMPKWTPGKQRGIPVRVKYIIPVTYKVP